MSIGREVLMDRIRNSGMTQKEIADGSGVHQQTISRFMINKGDMTLGNAEKIDSFLATAKVSPRKVIVRKPKTAKVEA